MIAKQVIIDLCVVLAVPIILIGGWLMLSDDINSGFTTDDSSVSMGADEPGVKTKLALDTLKSVVLDNSLFGDEAYTTLQPFSTDIPEVQLSRDFPFTQPPVILERLRELKSINGGKIYRPSVPVATTTPSLSSQIDKAKQSVR